MMISVKHMTSLEQKLMSAKHQVVAQMTFLVIIHLVTFLLISLAMYSPREEVKMSRFLLKYRSWKLSKDAEKLLHMRLMFSVILAMEVVFLLVLYLKHVKPVEVLV